MSDLNTQHNRTVWCDVPVSDVERAAGFYRAVLAVDVHVDSFNGTKFGVLAHDQGNGGCLVVTPGEIAGKSGILVYFNVAGRIRDALKQVEARGGKVVQPVHPIGPHGFRAIVLDSEGNRIALHSPTDA